jgi:hypothetical protein
MLTYEWQKVLQGVLQKHYLLFIGSAICFVISRLPTLGCGGSGDGGRGCGCGEAEEHDDGGTAVVGDPDVSAGVRSDAEGQHEIDNVMLEIVVSEDCVDPLSPQPIMHGAKARARDSTWQVAQALRNPGAANQDMTAMVG